MHRQTRRTFLGALAVSSVTAVAGCLGDDSGATERSLAWLPAGSLPDDEVVQIIDMDVPAVRDSWPDGSLEDFELEAFAQQLGTDTDAFDRYVAGMSGFTMLTVLEGDFDADEVADALAMDDESFDSYEEYTVVDEGTYVSDDAIVIGPDPEAMIAAEAGDDDRLSDELEHLDAAIDAVGGADMTMVLQEPHEDADLVGMALNVPGGDTVSLEGHGFFADADTAEEVYEDEEDDFAGDIEEGDIDSVELQGNVIVVEATTDVDDFF